MPSDWNFTAAKETMVRFGIGMEKVSAKRPLTVYSLMNDFNTPRNFSKKLWIGFCKKALEQLLRGLFSRVVGPGSVWFKFQYFQISRFSLRRDKSVSWNILEVQYFMSDVY